MILNVCESCHNVIIGADIIRATNRCNCNTKYFECDEDVYPMLRVLWDKGYKTRFSCSGHVVSHLDCFDTEASTKPDYNAYISIDGPSVKVKDFMKYKYGYAEIYIHDPATIYINEMRCNDIRLDDDYELTPTDEIFINYLAKHYPDEKDDILKWFSSDLCNYTFNIRPSNDFMDKYTIPGYNASKSDTAENYINLLELRHDFIKLIQLLPYNR